MRRPIAMFVTRVLASGESFLLRELRSLEHHGQPVMLVRVRPMLSGAIFRALWRRPAVVLRLLGWVLGKTWMRPPILAKSLLVFPLAAELAEQLPKIGIRHVHAHFATHAATMAVIVSKLAGIPYSFTAHAHAIFVDRSLLREKMRDAVFVRTTTEFNRRFLESLFLVEAAGKIRVVHVGAERIGAPAHIGAPALSSRASSEGPGREGRQARASSPARPGPSLDARDDRPALRRVVTVATNKPHKGIPVLREACALLGIEPTITQDAAAIANADVYVQPSVIAPNGQMDGMPVALIDAMAAGKPVVASAIGGIPELVVHEESGLLVDPANPRMLADAIHRVLHDDALRAKLSRCAQEKIAREFCLERCTAQLVALFAS